MPLIFELMREKNRFWQRGHSLGGEGGSGGGNDACGPEQDARAGGALGHNQESRQSAPRNLCLTYIYYTFSPQIPFRGVFKAAIWPSEQPGPNPLAVFPLSSHLFEAWRTALRGEMFNEKSQNEGMFNRSGKSFSGEEWLKRARKG